MIGFKKKELSPLFYSLFYNGRLYLAPIQNLAKQPLLLDFASLHTKMNPEFQISQIELQHANQINKLHDDTLWTACEVICIFENMGNCVTHDCIVAMDFRNFLPSTYVIAACNVRGFTLVFV